MHNTQTHSWWKKKTSSTCRKFLLTFFFLFSGLSLLAQENFEKFISNFQTIKQPYIISKVSFTDSFIKKQKKIEKVFADKFLVNEYNKPFVTITNGQLTYKYVGKLNSTDSSQTLIILSEYEGEFSNLQFYLVIIKNQKIETFTTIAGFEKNGNWEKSSICNINTDLISIKTEHFNLIEQRVDESQTRYDRYKIEDTGLINWSPIFDIANPVRYSNDDAYNWFRQLSKTRTETVEEFISNFPSIILPLQIDTNFFLSSPLYFSFSEKVLSQFNILCNRWTTNPDGSVKHEEFSLHHIGKYSISDSLTAVIYLIKRNDSENTIKDWEINVAVLNALGQISTVISIADGIISKDGKKILHTAFIDEQKIIHCMSNRTDKRKVNYGVTVYGYEEIKK